MTRRSDRAAARAADLLAALWLPLLLAAGLPEAQAATPLGEAINLKVREARRVAPALGVHVLEVGTGEQIYAFEADEPRIIASNTKLLTTAVALDRLGPGFFFETEVLLDGVPEGGRLAGHVAVVGGGDPNLSGRHYDGDSLAIFRRWGEALAGRGARRVMGDLLLVHGLFSGPRVHPDWPRDQLSRWYEAPVAALSFNDNCVLVRVRPGPRPGSPAIVETVPDLGVFAIRNSARTTGSSKEHAVRVDRHDEGHEVTVSGAVYRGASPIDTWVAVADPLAYFGAALRRGMEEAGVTVEGRLRETEQLPDGAWEPLTVHRTDLLTTLEVINKRSQNFYAESLLKVLGARFCGVGSWGYGLQVVAEFLRQVGLEPGSFQLADGSGMSRNNRFSPRQLTTLLLYMFRHPRAQEFIRSLPHSGEEDLSWERRLAEPPFRGNVFAKTGSLSGVSTLSGYAKGRSGRIYAFSILCNRTSGGWHARRAQDAIVRALIEGG